MEKQCCRYSSWLKPVMVIMAVTLVVGLLSACTSGNEEFQTTNGQTENPVPPSSAPGSSNGDNDNENSNHDDNENDSETNSNPTDSIVLEYGDTMELAGSKITVEDPAVAEVKQGILTAKSVGTTIITVDGAQLELIVHPAVVDVVLFTGQSNMVGRETSRYKVDIPAGQAYEFKHLTNELTEVANPVGETFGEVEVSSGSSIVPQFCADYVSATGRKIVAVHLARGGRSISYFRGPSGQIYKDILTKYGECMEYLSNNDNFTVGHQFYVMFQGETDTNNNMSESVYKSSYLRFHDGLKENFSFEFGCLIGNGRNSDPDSPEGVARIGKVKAELAAENDDIILADVSAYNWYMTGDRSYFRSDLIHLNAEGLKIVANEACKNILNFMGLGDDPTLAGVDPVTYLQMENDR